VPKIDDYLSKIIGKMRSNYPDSWVFYSSDHGQGLGGKSGQFNQDPHLNIIHNFKTNGFFTIRKGHTHFLKV
jgi:glucan phosphoethanolaminetransferase (alkaline phosphatase superfamily)